MYMAVWNTSLCYIVDAMKPVRSFASDNNAGVHPKVLQAIAAVNRGHVVGYGGDSYTEAAVRKFKQHFGSDIEVFVVFNGTAANCLSLKTMVESYHAVICAAGAHIYTDECGAPEKFTGCKLIPIPTADGKLTVESVRHAYHGIGDQHHVQPRVISITQASELGTVYTPREVRDLARFAHERNMFLHMDGARIANAAVSLTPDCSVNCANRCNSRPPPPTCSKVISRSTFDLPRSSLLRCSSRQLICARPTRVSSSDPLGMRATTSQQPSVTRVSSLKVKRVNYLRRDATV